MKLQNIGFYTLSDERAATASPTSPLCRCELILTARCNFHCPYCRHVGGKDLPFSQAAEIVKMWCADGLKNIRFSGGEPTLYPGVYDLVAMARDLGCERIAISTNGSADQSVYERLMKCGVNDFSVSLDACCAEDGDKMAGGVKGAWDKVIGNLRYLSSRTYVTVGVVLTRENAPNINEIIYLAHGLGVSDIRIIPAAQEGGDIPAFDIDESLLEKYPILRYRWQNLKDQKPVRGIRSCDSSRCGLVQDDMAVMGSKHYPCIIYMREGGLPIGDISGDVRQERYQWSLHHDTHEDPICKKNCLDVCIHYNNTFQRRGNEAE